ncbi:MAG: hypothetical protein ACP6IS_03495 [Candidatus Asgardarchaeia archaeon]
MSNERDIIEKKSGAQSIRDEKVIVLEEITFKYPNKKPPNFSPKFYKIIVHTPKNPSKIKLSEL